MIAQLKGEAPRTTSLLAPVEHSLIQRNELKRSLFEPADDHAFARIIEAMTQLCRLQEVKPGRNSPDVNKSFVGPCDTSADQAQPTIMTEPRSGKSINNKPQSTTVSKPRPIKPLHLDKRTPKQSHFQKPASTQQSLGRCACLFCHKRFRRSDHLRRHYRTMHFQYQVGPFPCPVPNCGKIIKDPQHFSNHAVTCHKADLGVRASIMNIGTRQTKPGQLATFTL